MLLPCPVKLNLFLHITGRRPDGYHLLQTQFQLLDYGDTIHFSANQSGLIQREDNHTFAIPDEDICVQAARLLQHYTGSSSNGVSLRLNKIVPPGTGLGAGSSNAATTLLGLNQIWNLGLTLDELQRLGAKLGADVPVFVLGQSALAEGIGEQLYPKDIPTQWYCVLIPEVTVSTATIFADPTLPRDHPIWPAEDIPSSAHINTLQTSTINHYPLVGEALQQLKQHQSKTTGKPIMSGTGAAVFLSVPNQQQGQDILDAVQGFNGFVAKGCNQSPLHQALSENLT